MNVVGIANSALGGCTSLTSITIGSRVTSIGETAFAECTGLTSITIGSGVTNIGDWAFILCGSLTEVYCYADNPPRIKHFTFNGPPLLSATLHVPAGSVNAYKAVGLWNVFGSIVAIE